MGKYSHVWSGVYTLFFFSQVKKNTAVSGILLLLQLLVLVFFLLQYTVSYSEDFFSRCEDFFPKQLSKTCGSYENLFSKFLISKKTFFRNFFGFEKSKKNQRMQKKCIFRFLSQNTATIFLSHMIEMSHFARSQCTSP